jgi:uncharacterized protein (TIGR02118 family)
VSKFIFILQRNPDTSHEDFLTEWNGQRHTALVERVPGLQRWVQDHVVANGDDLPCDGIGELWFDTDEALHTALSSTEMAAAFDDAAAFVDLERSGMCVVEEHTIVG